MERVERVEPDADREGRGDHEPTHRRVAEPAVDGAADDIADRGHRADVTLRREADVMHEQPGGDERDAEERGPQQVGNAEVRQLRHDPAGDRAHEHRGTADDLCSPEHRLQVALVAGRGERIDEPCLGRPGEEREAEPEQDRRDRPADERRLELPHREIEERREQERGRAEEEREPSSTSVGDDAGRDLEDDLTGREERVRRERLEVGEAGIEQEDRVDAPDERRCQGRQQDEQQVDPLDVGRGRCPGQRRGGQDGASRKTVTRLLSTGWRVMALEPGASQVALQPSADRVVVSVGVVVADGGLDQGVEPRSRGRRGRRTAPVDRALRTARRPRRRGAPRSFPDLRRGQRSRHRRAPRQGAPRIRRRDRSRALSCLTTSSLSRRCPGGSGQPFSEPASSPRTK